MARKKKTDSMIKAVPLPESDTNIKDTWNPAELNEETKTKDTWNPAVINEELKRFDSWNPAELNSYLTNKYNLEAVHDADIDDYTAHFVTLEPSTIQEIDYDIDQETGTSSQAILQSATMPAPGNNSPYVYRPNPADSTGRNFCYQPELIGGSVVWNQLVDTNTTSVTITSGNKYIHWNGSTLTKATSDGTAISVTGGTDKIYDISAMFGNDTVPTAITTAKFAELFPDYTSYAYSAPTIQSTKVSAKVVKDSEDTTIATYDLSGSHVVNRKYALVDLGDLTWTKDTTSLSVTVFRSLISDRKAGTSTLICSKYTTLTNGRYELSDTDKAIASWNNVSSQFVGIRDDSYSSGTAEQFKTAMSGVKLVYELDTPTTETVTNPTLYGIPKLDSNNNLYYDGDTVSDIPNVQVIETGGTQEYVDAEVEDETRDVAIPAGGQEYYFNNITVVTVPDPPETLTSASVSIDNEGIVTITDTSGEEPATYTTSIDMPDTLQGDNYLTVVPGNLTGVKYTRIQPKIRRTKK